MFTFDEIKNISKDEFTKLSPDNKELVLKILSEYKEQGSSKTLKELWEVDYNEIPVSIDEFICNPNYLGKSTRNGESIYPYWRQKYREIFDQSLNYEEIVLSGAIGIGKTRTAVICLCYLLYKLMCLKNPQEYFRINEGDKITIFFLNITLSLAEGVGYQTMHEYLRASPWFLERGTVTGVKNLRYNPPHNIAITFGSKGEHALGQQIYCLSGETKILTSCGTKKLKDLRDKKFNAFCIDSSGNIVESEETTVRETAITNDYYEIELEDGTVLKCTPEHRFMLKDGSYKMAKDLTEEDELFDNKPFGYIYMSENVVNGVKYIGQHHGVFESGYKGSGVRIREALKIYGSKNFNVTLLRYCYSQEELDEFEKYYISLYDASNNENFYNISTGGLSNSFQYGEWRESHRRNLGKSLKGRKPWNKGHTAISDERVKKHCYNFLGRHHTDETKEILSRLHKKENLSKETIQKMSDSKIRVNGEKGTVFWINNGVDEHLVNEQEFNSLYNDYNIGRLCDMVYMFKGDKTVKVHKCEADKYLCDGYSFGKSDKINRNISKSKCKEIWSYCENNFCCARELTDFLRNNGYPSISKGTVVNISNGTFVKSYPDLFGKIVRNKRN